jgi:hypothetical protein
MEVSADRPPSGCAFLVAVGHTSGQARINPGLYGRFAKVYQSKALILALCRRIIRFNTHDQIDIGLLNQALR